MSVSSFAVTIAVDLTFVGHLKAMTSLILFSMTELEVAKLALELGLKIYPAVDELIKRFKEKTPIQVMTLWNRWNQNYWLQEYLKIIEKTPEIEIYLEGMMSWAVQRGNMEIVRILTENDVKVTSGQIFTYLTHDNSNKTREQLKEDLEMLTQNISLGDLTMLSDMARAAVAKGNGHPALSSILQELLTNRS